MTAPGWSVRRLAWIDQDLGAIALPGGTLRLRSGFGSGLSRRRGDPEGRVWAISDRGPNIKIKDAVERYGLDHLAPLALHDGAKIMPRLDIGPAIAELHVSADSVELVRTIRIKVPDGSPVSGLPGENSLHCRSEPVFDLAGNPIAPDPSGLDTEGIAVAADGSFWAGDEFGPSLLRIALDGTIMMRLVPDAGDAPAGEEAARLLPALAGKRQLNRGFEALALSADEQSLFIAFQSPLAHPDEAVHERATLVRIWQVEAASGKVKRQYLYPLDPPESFRRDCARGDFQRKDIKLSELACIGEGDLLVLERGSQTTKIYRLHLADAQPAPPEHLDLATRPTIEQLSAGEDACMLPVVAKSLLFSSDNAPEVSADLEGMAILSPTELLLVSDNDFGVEGAETSFWKVTFEAPVLG